MFDETKISCDDFLTLEIDRLNQFARAYGAAIEAEENPADAELTDFEWVAAYEAWIESVYSEEPDVTTINDNNPN